MKTVILTQYWKNSSGGGVKNYTIMLSNYLEKYFGVDIKIIFRNGKDPVHIKGPRNKLFFVFYAVKYLMSLKPDLIIEQEGWSSLIPAIIYQKVGNNNSKIISVFHTQPIKKMHFLKKYLYEQLYNRCDYLGFVSKTLLIKEEKINGFRFNRDKVIITYAGIETPKNLDQRIEPIKKEYKLNKSYPILLGLGLFSLPYKAKGAGILIDAIDVLKEVYPTIKLILTGDGRYKGAVERYVKKKMLSDAILFPGYIDNQQDALAVCDVYTHISFGEGLPIAIYEALAAGKPIIASRSAGGVPEIIKNNENGILVSSNVNEIISSVKKVVMNPVFFKKISINAKKTIKESFTPYQMAKRFYDIYAKRESKTQN